MAYRGTPSSSSSSSSMALQAAIAALEQLGFEVGGGPSGCLQLLNATTKQPFHVVDPAASEDDLTQLPVSMALSQYLAAYLQQEFHLEPPASAVAAAQVLQSKSSSAASSETLLLVLQPGGVVPLGFVTLAGALGRPLSEGTLVGLLAIAQKNAFRTVVVHPGPQATAEESVVRLWDEVLATAGVKNVLVFALGEAWRYAAHLARYRPAAAGVIRYVCV
eukprot:RCo037326